MRDKYQNCDVRDIENRAIIHLSRARNSHRAYRIMMKYLFIILVRHNGIEHIDIAYENAIFKRHLALYYLTSLSSGR